MEMLYYVNAYGFLILGVLLIVCNLPVLVAVCCERKLRNQYGVLIISLFNAFLSGVVSAGYGIFRIVIFTLHRDNELLTVSECFYNPLTVFLLWTFPMTGLGLLLNSIDRLIVVSSPLFYFKFNADIVFFLHVVALIINAATVVAACVVTITLSPTGKQISILCHQHELYSHVMFISLSALRTLFAIFAVLIMLLVLVLLVKQSHVKSKQAFHTEETMKRFKARQINYTKTMLISCVATFVFYIIPSVMSATASLFFFSDVAAHVITWSRFISFFNSFNIAFLVVYRQRDVRCRISRIVNRVFRGHLSHSATLDTSHMDH